MQKVSGNKKTRVLTHKQQYISNSNLQAPLEQTLHLRPQKNSVLLMLAHRPQSFEATSAIGDGDAVWMMGTYQRGDICVGVRSAPSGGGSEQEGGQ